MRQLVASLVVFVALCALAISGAQAAPPVILSVDLERGRTMHLDWGGADYYELMHIAVSDADGAADLISITVTDPKGEVHTITPAGGPDLGWGVWNDTTIGAYWAAGQTTAPPPGAYTVTVTDAAAETDTLTTVPSVAVPDLVPTLLYPTNNALITEDTPTFSWTDVLAGAESWVYVAEVGFGPGSAWTHNAGSATAATYNSDGMASPATLAPGHTYLWLAQARRRDGDGADPRVSITTCQGTFGSFTTYSPVPHFIHVYIDRGIDVPPSDRPITYRERMEGAYITDGDGADDVACVTLVDTDGVTHVITPTTGGKTEWLPLDSYRLYVFWGDFDLPSPPTPGVYAVTVTDKEGNSDSLTTPYAPLVSSLYPHLLYPAPDYPVVPETAPTFAWTEGVPGATDYLNVWDEATGESLWDYITDTATSVPYDVDGSAALAELVPGHTYVWQIHAWSVDDESDPRVTIRTLQHSYGVFTIYSPLPSIQSVSITRSRTVDAEGNESFGECAAIVATDCDGWEELTITTVDPAERVRPGSGDCGQTSGDGPYTARQNWAQWEQIVPLAAGSYTVTAADQGGAGAVRDHQPGEPFSGLDDSAHVHLGAGARCLQLLHLPRGGRARAAGGVELVWDGRGVSLSGVQQRRRRTRRRTPSRVALQAPDHGLHVWCGARPPGRMAVQFPGAHDRVLGSTAARTGSHPRDAGPHRMRPDVPLLGVGRLRPANGRPGQRGRSGRSHGRWQQVGLLDR
jgi:hypothetical protein